MMMGQDLEGLAAEIARDREANLKQQALLARLPRRSPLWQRWLGDGMVLVGAWLTGWGEWLAQREYRESIPVTSK